MPLWPGISTNTTWTPAGSPYIISTPMVRVLSGATLTMQPGTVVQMGSNEVLSIQGRLSSDSATITDDLVAETGGDVDLCNTQTGSVEYRAGSTGTVTESTGGILFIYSDSVSISGSDFASVQLYAPATITDNTLGQIIFYSDFSGSLVITGNNINGGFPLQALDPDFQIRGLSGNTFSYLGSPRILLGGNPGFLEGNFKKTLKYIVLYRRRARI